MTETVINDDLATQTKTQRLWAEWKGFILFLSIMIFFRVAIADWNHVPSGSMRPNLIEGDRIWVNKLAYDIKIPYTDVVLKKMSDPVRGDVMVFFAPDNSGTRMVKRLVGMPGDKIDVRDNVLKINGEVIKHTNISLESTTATEKDLERGFIHLEEQLPEKTHSIMVYSGNGVPRALRQYSSTVPQGKYLMMGDNRDQSKDSRVWGFVPRESIIGRSSTIVMSIRPAKEFFVPRSKRFFKSVQ